jgi:hypothetical protein
MQATAPCGFSADTEILTRSGWVTFDRLTYLDEVAARSPDGEFLWEHPRSIAWGPYGGEMIWFHGRAIDLLVAPDHPVLWMTDARTHYPKLVTRAQDVLARSYRISRKRHSGFTLARSTWNAPDIEEVTFPGTRHTKMGPRPRDVRMTGDQFAAFMGMYAAEGSATRGGGGSGGDDWLVSISQTPGGKGYKEYRELLADIFGKVPGASNYGTVWVLHSRALYDYLQPLGKARDKRLPAVVMEMSRRQLQIFWDYYFLGDGNCEIHPGASTASVTATASKRLADQTQEIVQKLGMSAAVREYKTRPTSLVASAGIIYKVRVRATERPAFGVSAIPYSGAVGQMRVTNEAVYVRRSGKPVWAAAS